MGDKQNEENHQKRNEDLITIMA